MLLKGGTENRGTRSPDVQGFPREYFSILSGGMQLVRTWHRLDFMLYYRYKKRETTDGRSHLSQLRNNRFSLVAMGGYFFLFVKFITKEMILNIITVNPVRKIPIWIKLSRVMYTASPPFKVQRTFGRWIDRLTSKVSLVNILAYYRGGMQLVRTWQQLDFMLYYRYKKRETTDGRSLVLVRITAHSLRHGAVISFC